MTVFLVGLPHTPFDEARSTCAFTAKAVRMVEMWRNAGEDVEVIWGDGWSEPGDEARWEWSESDPRWRAFNDRAISRIRSDAGERDLVALLGGSAQRRVRDARPDLIYFEPAVGYEAPLPDTWWATESYAWLHHRYAAYGINDGRAFDTVIPPFQRASDFATGKDEGYALYLGRHIERKGVLATGDIARGAGLPLKTAGPGDLRVDGAEYLGILGPSERREALAHASVLITPTQYIEPGANVMAEAMMSGVGVVATDWGVFTDYLPRKQRFRTLKEAVSAVEWARSARGKRLQKHARSVFSMESCTPLYAEWFSRLRSLWGDGWYAA